MHYQIKTLQKYIHQQYPVKNNGNKDFMDISQKKKLNSQEDLMRNMNWLCIKYVLTLLIGLFSRVIEKQDE